MRSVFKLVLRHESSQQKKAQNAVLLQVSLGVDDERLGRQEGWQARPRCTFFQLNP